jgi:hypothetical protein
VDAADYLVWRNTVDSTTDLRADANLNGVIDAGDYQMWSANFGRTGPTGASGSSNEAVPEPSSFLMVLAVASMMAASFKHRGAPKSGG